MLIPCTRNGAWPSPRSVGRPLLRLHGSSSGPAGPCKAAHRRLDAGRPSDPAPRWRIASTPVESAPSRRRSQRWSHQRRHPEGCQLQGQRPADSHSCRYPMGLRDVACWGSPTRRNFVAAIQRTSPPPEMSSGCRGALIRRPAHPAFPGTALPPPTPYWVDVASGPVTMC